MESYHCYLSEAISVCTLKKTLAHIFGCKVQRILVTEMLDGTEPDTGVDLIVVRQGVRGDFTTYLEIYPQKHALCQLCELDFLKDFLHKIGGKGLLLDGNINPYTFTLIHEGTAKSIILDGDALDENNEYIVLRDANENDRY